MNRLAFALLFLLASVTNLQAQAPFYQGKTIRIIVGNLAGDAYDLWASGTKGVKSDFSF